MGRNMRQMSAVATAAEEALSAARAQHARGNADEAERLYRGLLRKAPKHFVARAMLGGLLLQVRRFDEAVETLGAAIADGAGNAETYNNYSLALWAAVRFDDALEAGRTAIALKPDFFEAHLNLGNQLRNLERLEEAETIVRGAIELNRDFAPAWVALGNVQTTAGNRDGAIASYQKALELWPGDATAFYHLTVISKAGGATVPPKLALAFRRIADQATLSLDDGILVNSALGLLADRSGRYDEAFARFRRSNELLLERRARRGETYDRRAHSALVDRIIETFTPAFFAARKDAGRPGERLIFIVGVPRSGTTLTEQILSSHPGIFGAGELEDIFDMAKAIEGYPEALADFTADDWRRRAAAYLAHIDALDSESTRVCDKLPRNFIHLGLIAVLFPGARVVHCRRNGTDTCLSNYFHYFSSLIRYNNDFADLAAYYRDYHRLMTHWKSVLPLPIFDLHYEEMVGDQERVTRGLIDFAGVEWDDACLAFHRNPRPVRTASNIQVRQTIYKSSVERWRNYERHVGVLRQALGRLAD